MSILSRRQMKAIDRLFFNAHKLQEAVMSIAAERAAKAEASSDPTARSAVEHLVTVPHACGYDNPELWLQAVKETWEKYDGTPVGETMRQRYELNKPWQSIECDCYVSGPSYFRYYKEFILYAALKLARKGIDLELDDGKMLSEWCKK